MSHGIALPPVLALGSDDLQARIIPPVLAGDWVAALAVTEPGGGSDVANLCTTATLDGDQYVLRGEKVFITSGMRADLITVAARTGGPGGGGISLFAVQGHPEGLSRSPMHKMGWWCSDTATLRFDDVRVPASNRIGSEGMGFWASCTISTGNGWALPPLRGRFLRSASTKLLRGRKPGKHLANR